MDRWIRFETWGCGRCIRSLQVYGSTEDAKDDAMLNRKHRLKYRWAKIPGNARPITLDSLVEYETNPPDQADFEAAQKREAEESIEIGTERKEVDSEF